MYTCEIIKEDEQFRFECLDYRGFSVLRSVVFDSRDEALLTLNHYLNFGSNDYVYEVCEGEDCHYFKITYNGLLLLESRPFDDKEKVYDFVENLKGGCIVSHIIDKSFESGEVFYYLTCTLVLHFKSPVKIKIETEEGQYVASIPEFNLFSYSKDVGAAINELKLDLDDLYEDLFIKNYKLSSKAKLIKEEFESKLILDGVSPTAVRSLQLRTHIILF